MPVLEYLSPEDALARAQTVLGSRAEVGLNFGQLDVVCEPGDLVDVVRALRDDDALAFVFFTFLSAVDRSEFGPPDKPEMRGGLEVLIHLYSPDKALHVTIHAPVDFERPECPSITGLFMGAEWHEREAWEMFGIRFEGHPRLVNLYLPEDFQGTPLRRAFRLPSRFVKDWPGAKDPEEAAAGGR